MKKKFLLVGAIALMSSAALNAQVTIGSGEMPNATLDVVATDGSTPNGLIAPRLTRAQLNSFDGDYKAAQIGAIVYVNDATSGTATNKAINVNAVGYYYFDGNVWQRMSIGTEWYKAGSAEDAMADKSGDISRSGRVAIYRGDNPTTASAASNNVLEIIHEGNVPSNDDFVISTYSDTSTPAMFQFNYHGTKAEPLPLMKGERMGALMFGTRVGTTNSQQLSGVQAVYQGNGTTSMASDLSLVTSKVSRMYIDTLGNVGIGNNLTARKSKLEVDGAITNTGSFNAGASSTIDFSRSNLARTTFSSGNITLQNVKDGGVYKLLIGTPTASSTIKFIAPAGFTSILVSDNSGTVNGYRMYTITAIAWSLLIDVDVYN
jgi:hypothetical protein